ncbi:MAG TPA: hypothetical protein VF331_01335 [Polyangiales bacterium]
MRATLSVVFLASASTMYLGLQGRHVRPFYTTDATPPLAVSGAAAHAAATPLDFGELLAAGADLRLSGKALQLDGQRVHMIGFMAQLELPPDGGFYLAPHPVRCDEAGGGTADLPIESVLVLSRSAQGRPVPFIGGLLEVTGILQTGNQADADGRVSALRILLDGSASQLPPVLAAANP